MPNVATPHIELIAANWCQKSAWIVGAVAAHILLLAGFLSFHQAPLPVEDVISVSMLPMAPPANQPPAPKPKSEPVKQIQPKPTPVTKPVPTTSPTAISQTQPVSAAAPSDSSTTQAPSGANKASNEPVTVGVDINAAYLNNPPPVYPAMSQRLGEAGTVMLEVTVQPDGTASKVSVYRSSGYGRLDDAAQNKVKLWKFVSAKRGGEAIVMTVHIPIKFVPPSN